MDLTTVERRYRSYVIELETAIKDKVDEEHIARMQNDIRNMTDDIDSFVEHFLSKFPEL